MKRTIDEHAERFDTQASSYDDDRDPTYVACRDAVIDAADVRDTDVVIDIGTGTGAIALAIAPGAKRVIGRDISEGMLAEAARKAAAQGLDNVEFGHGRFLEPNVDGDVDIITSNFALHHLDDERKAKAIALFAERYAPRQVVLGDIMLFDEPDPAVPFFDPSVDDPATVDRLVEAFTAAGFVVADVTAIHPQAGVIVAVDR